MLIKIIVFLILLITNLNSENLNYCKWNNKEGVPCISIKKTLKYTLKMSCIGKRTFTVTRSQTLFW